MSRRTRAAIAGDALLWVAAAGGALCIALVVAAQLFHISLIMFKTGSMEPTIPTGSLALVRETPASELEIGDIVTVDRSGVLPVTHRIIAIKGTGELRTITLKGDANSAADPLPYQVEQVRTVMAWAPGLARVVVWLSHPVVLGAITVGATVLVTWAFWPRTDGRGRRRAVRRRMRSGRPARTAAAAGATTTVLLALVAVAAAPAPAAHAAEVETVVSSTYLELTSISDPDLLMGMTPMSPVIWQVGVDASAPEPGLVHLGLAGTGDLVQPGDLSITVDRCSVRWVGATCAGVATSWLAPTDLAWLNAHPTAYGAHEVGSMDAATVSWLRIGVTLTDPAAVPGQQSDLRLQAWGAGGPLATGPSGSLASTGGGMGFLPAPLALAAIAAGLAVAAVARRREAGDPDA